MKKTITLLAGSFLWLGLAAQSDPNPTFKTEALSKRLIASQFDVWRNAAWRQADTFTFVYSGTRGGNENGTPYKSDMTTRMVWDTVANVYVNDNRTVSTYNAANELTTLTTIKWDGAAWQNIKKTNYIQSGLDAITLEQYWKSSAWMDSVRTTVSKNAIGQVTLNMNEIMVAGAWAAYNTKVTTTYNTRNLQEGFISFTNVGGVYVESRKFDFSYDAADNMVFQTISNWVSGAWVPANQYVLSYDANRNKTSQVTSFYVSGAFVPSDSVIWVFNSSNQNTDYYRYVYNSGVFNPQVHSLFQYDLQGNLTLFQGESWLSGAWQPGSKTEYQFNANNKQTQRIDYNWVSGAWVGSNKETTVYNANNNILERITYDWVSSAWQESQKTTWMHDANNNIIEQTTYNWVSSAWQGSSKTTWMYNANNLRTQLITYTASAGVFVGIEKYDWTYNSDNLYTTFQIQDGIAGAWINRQRAFYYYETYQDGVGISESSIKASAVYPNPFTKNTLIDFTSKTEGDLTFTVTDINGRVMHSENNYYPTGANSILFDGENLSAGVYIYTLSGKAGKTNGRILKK